MVDMFGNSSGAPDIAIDLPTCAEWPLSQKLNGERETLGHYLSGHPLDPYRDELQTLVGTHLGRLDQLYESAAPSRDAVRATRTAAAASGAPRRR